MKKLLILLIISAIAISCDKTIVPEQASKLAEVKVDGGRLSFKTTNDYVNTLDALFKMNGDALDEWENKFKISSIRKYFKAGYDEKNDYLNSFENASPSLQATLNASGEVIIGDTIVWFSNGIKHFVPSKDESLLSSIKANPSESKFTATYSITKVQDQNNNLARVIVDGNGKESRWQRDFTYYKGNMNTNAGLRKYVHELYATTQAFGCWRQGCNTQSQIYLRIKLEYRGSGGSWDWRPAGEQRSVTLNLNSFDAQYFSSGSLVVPFYAGNNWVNSSYVVNGDLVWPIASGSGPNYSGYRAHWSVELSGSIYHFITDDALLSNRWNNEGYPLW
ncbi:MAG: hypothetical protein HOP37_05485 [Cyclobacteriaceae bacterium]|nr:hypothetical protein [Cyclobacteriaceae bacterium]